MLLMKIMADYFRLLICLVGLASLLDLEITDKLNHIVNPYRNDYVL